MLRSAVVSLAISALCATPLWAGDAAAAGAKPESKAEKTISKAKYEIKPFRIEAEALVLTRTAGADNLSFVFNDTNRNFVRADDTVKGRTDDLGLSGRWRPTAKLTFGYDFTDKDALEASYFGFGLLDWKAERTYRSPALFGPGTGSLYVPFLDPAGSPFVDDNFADRFWECPLVNAKYESSLDHNAELYYVRTMVDANGSSLLAGSGLLGGLRYVSLDERLTVTGFYGDVPGTYSIRTANSLIGGELGGKLVFNPHDRIKVKLVGKVGLMANQADKRDAMQDDWTSFKNSTDDTHFAWLGDVAAKVEGKITEKISLVAGYSMLYVSGVALAPEQFDFTPTRVKKDRIEYGDAIYHGLNLGLKIRW
jgi:hypothetical protein